MASLKLPPQNIDAEKSVMGSILIDQEAIYKLSEFLLPNHFYKIQHREIYKVFLELYTKQKPIDILTVSSALKKKKKLATIGGAKYLSELVTAVPTAAHVEEYGQIIREASLRRNLISLASKIEELAYEEDKSIGDVVDEAESSLLGISQVQAARDFVHIGSLLEDAYQRAEELNKNPGGTKGIETGFPFLDNLLGGLQRSDLVILAARPSVGKTAFSLDIARHAAVEGKYTVGFFSLEMSNAQLMDRVLSMQVGVGLWDLRMGRIRDEVFHRLSDAMGIISESNLYIDDTPGIGIMEMRSKARKLKIENGLDLIIVDYLQLIEGTSKESRVQEVSEISRFLKGMARELDVPVLSLAQLSRAVEQRADGTPILSDLRDSGSIEQDADIVMFLSRVGGEEEGSDNRILTVAKHRNGPTGQKELFFVKDQARFREIDGYH